MAAPDYRKIYLSSHYALVLGLQTCYAFVYVKSPYLKNALVLPVLYRLIVWTLPVLVYLFWIRQVNPLDYLKLRKDKLKGIIWGLSVGLIILAVNLIAAFITSGHWRFNLDIGLNRWIGPVLLVGFSEDVLFRGFFLQEFAGRTTFFKANLLQAFLFLLIHFPGWFFLNQLQVPGIFQRIVTVMVFALVAGWVLQKSNSLWACMLVHSFNNFSSFAISNF